MFVKEGKRSWNVHQGKEHEDVGEKKLWNYYKWAVNGRQDKPGRVNRKNPRKKASLFERQKISVTILNFGDS